jgi:MFS transporter, DHA1 family, multidrug resistance protein
MSPTRFGMLFALHAIGIIGMSQFNAMMIRRWGARRLIGAGALALSLAGLAIATLILGGMTLLWPLALLTLFMFVCLGLILAPAFLTAMEPFGATAGAAAAIGSAVEFTFSTSTTFVMSMAADGTARPMAITLAVTAAGAFASWIYYARTATA